MSGNDDSISDPRWIVPNHSQQHPSDGSYQPSQLSFDTPMKVVASKAGRYQIVSDSDPSSASSVWIAKSAATQQMIDQWRSKRSDRQQPSPVIPSDRKRKRADDSSSQGQQSVPLPVSPHRLLSNNPPVSQAALLGASPYVDIPIYDSQLPFGVSPSPAHPDSQTNMDEIVPGSSASILIDSSSVPHISLSGPRRGVFHTDAVPDSEMDDHHSSTGPRRPDSSSRAYAPIHQMPLETFRPFLDHETGMEIDAQGRTRNPVTHHATDDVEMVQQSSPVDEFSKASNSSDSSRSPSPQYLSPQDVPRVGGWIVPRPPNWSRAKPSPLPSATYESDPIFSQLGPDDDLDPGHEYPDVLQQQQQRFNAAASPVQSGIPASQPSLPSTGIEIPDPLVISISAPRESTPTKSFSPDRDKRPLAALPSQSIASPPTPRASQAATDALIVSEITTPVQAVPHPLTLSGNVSSAPPPRQTVPTSSVGVVTDASTSSSLGWSTLPRPEIGQLIQRSPHVPAFLKDEVEKFVLKAKRASHSQRSAGYSQSQSYSNSQDDSETQEDGFLRTKNIWVFDLVVMSSDMNPTGLVSDQVDELVTRLTQSQTSVSQSRAIVLLLDTHEATFDLQEVEEHLAAILRNDRRYSPWYDANGRKWPTTTIQKDGQLFTSEISLQPSDAAQTEPDKDAEIAKLQRQLETVQAENEKLNQEKKQIEKERDETLRDRDFVRSLYDQASNSASQSRIEANQASQRADRLEQQLNQGLELHKQMAKLTKERFIQENQRIQGQLDLLSEQNRRTDDEIRKKAVLWDQQQANEKIRELERQARMSANEEKRRKMILQLSGGTDSIQNDNHLGYRNLLDRDPSPVDEMDELDALAREAEKAAKIDYGSVQDQININDNDNDNDNNNNNISGSSKRPGRRAAAIAAKAIIASSSSSSSSSKTYLPLLNESTNTVEAANLTSSIAAVMTREEVEDQFACFTKLDDPTTTTTTLSFGVSPPDLPIPSIPCSSVFDASLDLSLIDTHTPPSSFQPHTQP